MSVIYTDFIGRIACENPGGTETLYLLNTLGNVIETRDMNTGANTSGTTPSPFGFYGTCGYLQDTAVRLYIRARYYRPAQGR